MSELKATPGPWRPGISGNFRVYAPDGMGAESGLVAKAFSRENTNLIAAAPDLFEALEVMLADYREASEEWDSEIQEYAETVIDAARAALAKARGES